MKRFQPVLVGALVSGLLIGIPLTEASAAPRKKPAARIRESVSATRDEGTAAIEGSIFISADEFEARLTFDGVVDLGPEGSGQITMSGLDELLGFPLEIEMRMIGNVMYMDFGDLLGTVPPDELPDAFVGRNWIRMDLSDVAAASDSVAPGTDSDPSGQLDALRGVAKGSVETVGRETINGIRTTHYSAELDLAKARDAVPEEFRERFDEALAMFEGLDEIPTDVWLDAEGRVRRIRMTIDFEVEGQRLLEMVTFDYVDFGAPIDVVAPPADEVIDFQDFLELVEAPAA